MKYQKPPLSFQEQAGLLIKRGLIVKNRDDLISYLSQVNYYRLSGYWYSFKTTHPTSGREIFKPSTTFELIRDRYEFDRKLRLLLMDAIEKIEVTILRTRVIEAHTRQYGCFGYIEKSNYHPSFSEDDFAKLINQIIENEKIRKEEFINRYRKKYIFEEYLPLWMSVELMSFGQLFTFYRNQKYAFKQDFSRRFHVEAPVLDSWLHTLNYIRNACAHHVRLWNRVIPLPLSIPRKKHDSRWHDPSKFTNNRIFAVLTVIVYLLDCIDTASKWKHCIKDLIYTYPFIPLNEMGFPKEWQYVPFWK